MGTKLNTIRNNMETSLGSDLKHKYELYFRKIFSFNPIISNFGLLQWIDELVRDLCMSKDNESSL